MMQNVGICPECGDTSAERYRPFCSKRCADVDLSRWLRGAYAIPGGNADEDEDGDDANAPGLAQQALRNSPDGDSESGLH